MNAFVYHLLTMCTIFDETNYVTWSSRFWCFLRIHSHLSFLMVDPTPFDDPSHTLWFIENLAITTWLLKLGIPSISESVQLIIPTKAIWDEWSSMYGYESNVSWIVKVYEQLFKAKQLGRRLQDYYASIHGLFTKLELYQPYTTNLMTQWHYREELVWCKMGWKTLVPDQCHQADHG